MKFFLIDAHLIFGSVYHMMKNSGIEDASLFFKKCLKIIQNSAVKNSPTHALFCMDDYSKSERKISCQWYRSEGFLLPTEYYSYLPGFISDLKAIGIKSLSVSGMESYDIISTLVFKARASIPDTSFLVVAADKRLYSCFDKDFFLIDPFSKKGGSVSDLEWFKSKTSVSPDVWRDLISLTGYKERGIPGVKGVGIKKAESLIAQYGTVENMIKNIDSIEGDVGLNFRSMLSNSGYVSYGLSSLRSNLSLGITPNDMSCSF